MTRKPPTRRQTLTKLRRTWLKDHRKRKAVRMEPVARDLRLRALQTYGTWSMVAVALGVALFK